LVGSGVAARASSCRRASVSTAFERDRAHRRRPHQCEEQTVLGQRRKLAAMAAELARQAESSLGRLHPSCSARAMSARSSPSMSEGASSLTHCHEQRAQLDRVLHRQGAPGECERLADVALREQDAAEITIDIDQLRLQRQRAAILRRRLVPVSEAGE